MCYAVLSVQLILCIIVYINIPFHARKCQFVLSAHAPAGVHASWSAPISSTFSTIYNACSALSLWQLVDRILGTLYMWTIRWDFIDFILFLLNILSNYSQRELSWISISLHVTDVAGLNWEKPLANTSRHNQDGYDTDTVLASFLSSVAAAGPFTQSLPCDQGSPTPTRVPSGPCTQSLPCGQVSPAFTRDPRLAERRSTSPVLPEHGRESKKVKRTESKTKRKRDKNARAKSQTYASVPNVHDPSSTPMSVVNDDGVYFLLDRSLCEMLASGDERSREDADSSDDNIDHPQRLIEVEL